MLHISISHLAATLPAEEWCSHTSRERDALSHDPFHSSSYSPFSHHLSPRKRLFYICTVAFGKDFQAQIRYHNCTICAYHVGILSFLACNSPEPLQVTAPVPCGFKTDAATLCDLPLSARLITVDESEDFELSGCEIHYAGKLPVLVYLNAYRSSTSIPSRPSRTKIRCILVSNFTAH